MSSNTSANLSDPIMFSCTYASKLKNIKYGVEYFGALLCNNMNDTIVAVNSNYVHGSRPTYENFKKTNPKKANENIKGKARKNQGDGTCFNNAIEISIRLKCSELKIDTIYKVQFFSGTGESQVFGTKSTSFKDGEKVTQIWVNYLNNLLGKPDPLTNEVKVISIEKVKVNLMNYKCIFDHNPKKILINLREVAKYLRKVEFEHKKTDSANEDKWILIKPPFSISEVVVPMSDNRFSCLAVLPNASPKLLFFQSGKINILGSKVHSDALLVHSYIKEIFSLNWELFTQQVPLTDREKAAIERSKHISSV